jgi:hypothetical protein
MSSRGVNKSKDLQLLQQKWERADSVQKESEKKTSKQDDERGSSIFFRFFHLHLSAMRLEPI